MTVIGLAISLIGFGTAGLPHAYNSLRLMYEDRKDRRAAERAAFEHNNRIIELANNLNRTTSRLDALEGIEEAARELKRRYEDLEARYEREVNGELKPGIKTNSAGLSAILDSWHDRNPPSYPDPSDPLPHPAFDPLPDEPNPLARQRRRPGRPCDAGPLGSNSLPVPHPRLNAMAASWQRRPGESNPAFQAFVEYRGLGCGRTLEATRRELAKGPGYLRYLREWSTRWCWAERASDWDRHLRKTRDGNAAGEEEMWGRLRRRSTRKSWRLAQSLRDRVTELLAFPLTQEVQQVSKDGKTFTTIIKPAGWNYSSITAMAKLVVELESAIIADALPRDDDGFNPATATLEEFREYMARKGFRVPPADGPPARR